MDASVAVLYCSHMLSEKHLVVPELRTRTKAGEKERTPSTGKALKRAKHSLALIQRALSPFILYPKLNEEDPKDPSESEVGQQVHSSHHTSF